MQLVGTIAHSWKTGVLGLVGLKIVFQQYLELFQNSLVGILSCDILAVVEAGAIVQKQLDVGRNEQFAVLIGSLFELIPDFFKAIQNDFALFFGQVQGLLAFIRKKSVVINVLA